MSDFQATASPPQGKTMAVRCYHCHEKLTIQDIITHSTIHHPDKELCYLKKEENGKYKSCHYNVVPARTSEDSLQAIKTAVTEACATRAEENGAEGGENGENPEGGDPETSTPLHQDLLQDTQDDAGDTSSSETPRETGQDGEQRIPPLESEYDGDLPKPRSATSLGDETPSEKPTANGEDYDERIPLLEEYDGELPKPNDSSLRLKLTQTPGSSKSTSDDGFIEFNTSPDSSSPMSPREKVRFILTEKEKLSSSQNLEAVNLAMHALFCQMDVLCYFNDGDPAWKEAARWLKYEEKVEAGDRWSKPHVATTSLHALHEVRKAIEDHVVLLDMPAPHGCMHQVGEQIADALVKEGKLKEEHKDTLVEMFLRPHKHQHRKAQKSKKEKTDTNALASFLDPSLEESQTSNSKEKSPQKKKKGRSIKKRFHDAASFNELSALETSFSPEISYPHGVLPDKLATHKANKRLMKKIPAGSEAANILVGQVDYVDEPTFAFVRLEKSAILSDLTEVALPTRFVFLVLAPKDGTSIWEYGEIGRAMASMLIDRVYCELAYKAHTKQDLLDGIDEFIDDLTVLPPSIWDPATRLDPPEKTMSMDKIRRRLVDSARTAVGEAAFHFSDSAGEDDSLKRTGRFFGGLIMDVKSRYKYYLSDFYDGFHMQCLASSIFLYFACITPIVTFGGLLGKSTDGYMGTMETMLAGCICGLAYHLLAGQPLTIVGATGPLLIFESKLYDLCHDQGLEYLTFRFWIGMWIFVLLMLIVAFDLSACVRYITRFTEESFGVLISLIFIFEAFKKLAGIWHTHPIHTHTASESVSFKCHCIHPPKNNFTDPGPQIVSNATVMGNGTATLVGNGTAALMGNGTAAEYHPKFHPIFETLNWSSLVYEDCITSTNKIVVGTGCIDEDSCLEHEWLLDGPACNVYTVTHSVPDVFFFCCFLFIGTFVLAIFFRYFRSSSFFPAIIRSTVSDFAVLLAIVIWTSIDYVLDLATPKLQVPEEFKNTRPDRGWLVNPLGFNNWWIILLAVVPALLATILIFLDQQITAVIVNRKEHKLRKGHGYHLDLCVVSFLIAVCSLLGLPWFVAATVRSVTHVRSLIKESELRAPGERPQFLGVREQRLTGLVIHILIGLSVLITGILTHIPMAVLYGVFLYMGVTSLGGVQFVERILLLFMPEKYQPDLIYLRHVETKKVHIFTLIQIVCMGTMWAIKSIKAIALLFPLTLVLLCFIRKAMDYGFTQGDLFWLDHILPDEHRRKKEDEKRIHAEQDEVELAKMQKPEEKEPEKENRDVEKGVHFSEGLEDHYLDDEWDKIIAKRDYGDWRKFRKRTSNVIDRYRTKGGECDEDNNIPSSKPRASFLLHESFRERKFSI